MASAHETTVREVYEAANRRDMGANVYRGHDGFRRWTEDLWGDWESFDVSVGEVTERGDWRLIVRIEGFSDRDSARRAFEAT